MAHITISTILEQIVKIKRKWTDEYPAMWINPGAELRNKVILFIGSHERNRCERTELMDFFKDLDESSDESEKAPSRSWLYRNKHIVDQIRINDKSYYKLTKKGKRVYDYLNTIQSMNESSGAFTRIAKIAKAVLVENQKIHSIADILENNADQIIVANQDEVVSDYVDPSTEIEDIINFIEFLSGGTLDIEHVTQSTFKVNKSDLRINDDRIVTLIMIDVDDIIQNNLDDTILQIAAAVCEDSESTTINDLIRDQDGLKTMFYQFHPGFEDITSIPTDVTPPATPAPAPVSENDEYDMAISIAEILKRNINGLENKDITVEEKTEKGKLVVQVKISNDSEATVDEMEKAVDEIDKDLEEHGYSVDEIVMPDTNGLAVDFIISKD